MTETQGGLSEREARRRLAQQGPNQLKKEKEKSGLQVFWEQLLDPLIYVLLVAAGVSLLLREYSDAAIIAAVVLMNAFIGTLQEGKAKRALEALQKLQSPRAVVIRDGKQREINASELVLGDLVCLEAGCRVPADLKLTQSVGLKIEESALTGESVPVEKDSAFCGGGQELSLGDRKNMAYMSTIVTAGRGQGTVTAAGMQTELGRIADMIHKGKEELTPLQKRLGELGKVLSLLSLLLCGALFGIAVWQKRNVMQMLITAISLAVAAVPEGLPAVVTICLALSVTRMVRANTIVRRLPSVETLGAVSVVCSDKTGTLTQNHMTVEMGYWDRKVRDLKKEREGAGEHRPRETGTGRQTGAEEMPPRDFLYGLVLCNDARLGEKESMGDPTEVALLEIARKFGVEKEELTARYPRVGEIPFDSESKQMTTFHRGGGRNVGYRKGAPDVVLKGCEYIRIKGESRPLDRWMQEDVFRAMKELSRRAYRILAVAMQEEGNPRANAPWTFLGLAAMKDPARPEAARAVQILRQAGVRTVMITGDHVDTALAIGQQIGIAENPTQCMTGAQLTELSEEAFEKKLSELRIFARVSPAQKVRIVKTFQKKGGIVAMTGDGVNDAPSLKAADIGIAMGKNGTDVAKQAADMVLVDDNFATIEKAIEEGRGVYENIRKSVIFLLSSNLGELLTMFAAVILGFASPLKSSHILWINLITDSLPALALGVDQNDRKALMKSTPRKARESLFARGGLGCTCFYGLLIAGISLTAFFLPVLPALKENFELGRIPALLHNCLEQPGVLTRAQTYAFTVLGMSQLFHAVGMRDVGKSVFRMSHLENKLMILACAVGLALQFAVTEVPFLVSAFGTASLTLREWLILTGLAAIPLAAHEVIVLLSSIAFWGSERN